jgi:hypothetical protein
VVTALALAAGAAPSGCSTIPHFATDATTGSGGHVGTTSSTSSSSGSSGAGGASSSGSTTSSSGASSTTTASSSGSSTTTSSSGSSSSTTASSSSTTSSSTTTSSSSGCTPATCASLGADCGNPSDNCGHFLFCGTCSGSNACGADGTPYTCTNGFALGCDGCAVGYPGVITPIHNTACGPEVSGCGTEEVSQVLCQRGPTMVQASCGLMCLTGWHFAGTLDNCTCAAPQTFNVCIQD